jgi:circadian clock protein KaiC
MKKKRKEKPRKKLHKKKPVIKKEKHKKSRHFTKEEKITKDTVTERVSSGIPKFDQMTQGGFERNSINLLAGGSGSGKTIFSIQFLLEGVRRGEKVLYITFEEKKEEFYRNMKKFGWNLQKAEDSGNFIFLEYSPEKVKMMLDEGGGTIETTVLKYNISRLVIDSVTSFSLLFGDELSKRQAVLGLFDIIRKWNCTSLLTIQHNPSSTIDRGISPAEFEADSITLLYYVKVGARRKRFLEVLKMRGTDHSKEIHNYMIKKGIQIGSISNVRLFDE